MSRLVTLRALRFALIGAAAFVGSALVGVKHAHAQDYCGPYSRPDLFYNYYVPPVGCTTCGSQGARRRIIHFAAAHHAAGRAHLHYVSTAHAA